MMLPLALFCLSAPAAPLMAQASADESAQQVVLSQFARLSSDKALLSPAGTNLRTGEAAKWDAPTFGPMNFDRIIQTGPGTAVARMPATADLEDTYIYLRRVGGAWKVEAGRSLALMGVPRALRSQLERKPNPTSVERAALRNLRLMLSSDRELGTWFLAQHSRLQLLLNSFKRQQVNSVCSHEKSSSISAELVELGLTCIAKGDGDQVRFVIGGMVDNEVGFMVTSEPPRITSSEYIWIEPMGDGWYLYRTT